MITRACRVIDNAEQTPSLDELAATAGMSRYHFQRVFKAGTGVTPKAYAAACRAERVRNELTSSNTITEAIYGAGYNSNGRFYADATARLGMTPRAFRAGGAGVTMRFAMGECSLGAILVAANDKGVCAIHFGNDPEALMQAFQDRFPEAELIGADARFERLVAQFVGFVEAPAHEPTLPLDVRGTAFQQRVWQALRQIPPGSTGSYAEIAERIGQPTAARAVARACASNDIAVARSRYRVTA